MLYATLKATHIVFVVTWFAGLFYVVRLFVYLRELQDRPESEQVVLRPALEGMARRLWFGITWPSAVATGLLGGALLTWHWPPPDWLGAKLLLVGLLFAYHASCHVLHRRLQRGEPVASGLLLRVWNEVATVFLVGIVFLVVLKDMMGLVWGVGGLTALVAVLLLGIMVVRRVREGRQR